MGPDSQRQRSETVASAASSRRPKSRASTTSIHSASTQAAPQHQTESHPVTNSNAHPNLPVETQYTQEEIPSRHEQDLNSLYRGFVEQHQIQNQNEQQNSVGMEHEYSSHMPNASASGQWQAFGGRDPHAFGQTNEQGMQEDTGASESKRKKGSASSMANDQELRRLYRENKGRTLKDVASHVLANERGPRSEKTKQIFAMLW